MMNANWMVIVAIHNQKALAGYGYSKQDIEKMDMREVAKELKKLGYDFKANSPLKIDKMVAERLLYYAYN